MRTTTLNITEIKNENALYGFESLSVKLDEEGNLNIPEQIKNIPEIISLLNLVEINKDKFMALLFPEDYTITQNSWCNSQVIYPDYNEIIRIRTIPLTWEEFIICYNKYTKYDILPNDTLENIKEKIKEYNYIWRISLKGRIFGENTFLLDDGRYLFNNKGKYTSGLTFICQKNQLLSDFYHQNENLKKIINLNLDGNSTFCYGTFFKSKKGTPCFDITVKNPMHILIRTSWGGAFNTSRGIRNIPSDNIYYRRASSNGGGAGNDYLVIPIDFKNKISVDDI